MGAATLVLTLVSGLTGCSADTADVESKPSDFAQSFQDMLLDAKAGDVIVIPAGTHNFQRSLSLNIDGVTLRGAGIDQSILSFKGQIAGAEGLLVTASDFTIEDLAIEDSVGDALKVNEGNNITIRNVRTEWTNGPDTKNGAYGIYPVQTTNVLMEGNVAIGASDAGIYVGQSKNVIVRNNRAEYNVAGIEIENTIDADVYDNVAINNTGGILVFNMPALSQEGHTTRIFNNNITENNTKNFGHKGTPVASVPAGSGIVINSNDNVEIFGNEIKDNRTANIIISSVYSTNYSEDNTVEGYDAYPESIYIHDNVFSGGGNRPDGLDLKALKVALYGLKGRFPDVLWDGFEDTGKYVDGRMPAKLRICLDNGDATMINADGPGGYKNPVAKVEGVNCTLPRLTAVSIPGVE
jgi:parallel beta-helix repeat protein